MIQDKSLCLKCIPFFLITLGKLIDSSIKNLRKQWAFEILSEMACITSAVFLIRNGSACAM